MPTPRKLELPEGLDPGTIRISASRDLSPQAAPGGESEGRSRLRAWRDDLTAYETNHDLMAVDRTSRLSPYLRFGCLSPVDVARTAEGVGGAGAEAFIRQLCWRDFYYQLAATRPDLTTTPVRSVTEKWRSDPGALAAWHWGHTGVPIVDAGMRQLIAEGWMHNRARLLVASYLTKHLELDWREGAAWFERWLLDGDVPNNYGNWQWTAGVGTDTKPYRRFNPIRQAHRYDPDGDYVRRYVPELAHIAGGAVHEPWQSDDEPADGYADALW